MHHKVKLLIEKFLNVKRHFGTAKEKKIYEGMNFEDFIVRILKKRPLVFFGSSDMTLLRDVNDLGSMFPTEAWSRVGSEHEDDEITITEYMTYDEILIAALIGVSVPTFFINNGDRSNCSRKDDDGEYEREGIYVGLSGARFERRDKMESILMLLTEKNTTKESGYGKDADPNNPLTQLLRTWAETYEEGDPDHKSFYFPTYTEVKEQYLTNEAFKKKFHHHAPSNRPDIFFNIAVYKKRLALSILPFLLDADKRAQEQNKKAYLHVVGLGLGVWQIVPEQATWMLETYKELLMNHQDKLTHIHTVDFSWFPDNARSQVGIEHSVKNVVFSKRNPAEPLKDKNLLLVAMYAWDGNAFPGNEYWRGMLQASGDPAAACCSTISELQNPYINEEFVKTIIPYQ
uniref:Uncharacterized protein n=1 Tax=Arcella intermedia TaxID=1963864 RepID=A0A6B2L4W1_9EUKA